MLELNCRYFRDSSLEARSGLWLICYASTLSDGFEHLLCYRLFFRVRSSNQGSDAVDMSGDTFIRGALISWVTKAIGCSYFIPG